jgi:hypothetical protein
MCATRAQMSAAISNFLQQLIITWRTRKFVWREQYYLHLFSCPEAMRVHNF